MARQYPPEIFIGQYVHVRANPGDKPIESKVIGIDAESGTVYVRPIGVEYYLEACPRAVMDLNGQYLHYESHTFFFAPTPMRVAY